MVTTTNGDTVLTVGEAADVARVQPKAIRTWIRKGLLRAKRIGSHGHWRIARRDLERVLGLDT